MEESFSHFIERLKEDILSLDESKIKKKIPENFRTRIIY